MPVPGKMCGALFDMGFAALNPNPTTNAGAGL